MRPSNRTRRELLINVFLMRRISHSCFVPFRFVCVGLLISIFIIPGFSQSIYEKRHVENIEINFGGNEKNPSLEEQYRLIAREALGSTYSTARVRDSIEILYKKTKKIVSISVVATPTPAGGVNLRFDIKRKTQAEKVVILIGQTDGDPVTEQDLLFKLNLLTPGTSITDQTLRNNSDQILDYLREHGFYQSEVIYAQHTLQNENEVGVTFRVTPNAQAKVESFKIGIHGYDKPIPVTAMKLRKGGLYSRDRLSKDILRVREILRKEDLIAPELDEPRIIYDGDANTISIEITGKVGPTVNVLVETEKEKIGGGLQTKLFPIKREGKLDFAAIVEGERRLENYYQEQGYFFANVTPLCSVEPQLVDGENNVIPNTTEFLCSFLGGEDLINRKVEVKYHVDLDRQLRLVNIRVRGTDKLSVEDVRTVLGSQEANLLGVIPLFGYGRGYTSSVILEDDAGTIRTLMNELGYRDAQVHVNQGVSPDGEHLIITFVVEEGSPTIVGGVYVVGSKAFRADELIAQLPNLTGKNYSRAKVRNAARKLSEFYSQQGFYDARVIPSVIEPVNDKEAAKKEVRIEFKIEDEGKKILINRILVNGMVHTRSDAVLKALTLRTSELLRASDIYTSEQNLYGTDAFSRVEIKPRPAGNTPDGNRLTDLIVNVEEQPPRLMSYGGGFSTDLGLNGFFDIRHVNLFRNLWQGGARFRWSQRQQLVQFDFIDPRFIRDGEKRFAPLTITAQYQRDSTVTRFFRSAFDKGTFGIVQRIDANGNPVDEFGANAGSPTINRLGISAESNRTISRKNRSILFFRYRFENVRLVNIESLLIKDLLRPDSRIRISGFGATFVRDTRQNCSVKYSLLDLIAKGEQGEPCRYNASDPTKGEYLTAEYNISLPQLGANIGFEKFQASYNFYYTFPALKNTTLAARAIVGLAHVFSNGNRFPNAQFPHLEGILPISERFFAGGSNTLRGFDFEEAGPRIVIVPQGTFRNSSGNQVFLDPFTIPFGGNALAVVNLEARAPLSKSIRAVPFYDGGNVFRRVGDILHPPNFAASDVVGQNLRARWTHTVGLGLRLKTPVGGEFGVDYGYLLNPPRFLIPQNNAPNAFYRLPQGNIHFRFSQAF